MNRKIIIFSVFLFSLHSMSSRHVQRDTGVKNDKKNDFHQGKETEGNNKNSILKEGIRNVFHEMNESEEKTKEELENNNDEESFIAQSSSNYSEQDKKNKNNDSKIEEKTSESMKFFGQSSNDNNSGGGEEILQTDVPAHNENGSGIGEPGNNVENNPNDNNSGTNTTEAKYTDQLFEEIIANLSNKNGSNEHNYHNEYNEFKKEYDMFITMNENEYEIIQKLLDAFSVHNTHICKEPDSVYEAIKKTITDKTYCNELKTFVQGIYNYAKGRNNLRGEGTKGELYMTLFENLLKLLSSI
ncbi:MSP7-like protein, putative [Plasmodium malariae]|uniref:MSP7-like protein, putative n=2 Tax=Plasmodium malariae TaxID=5858 RepID=A0A1D3SP66_PLAMA|nr:MSP7-like protein, putative [Plasmodium malariae]SCO93701.1 MSP7-like protein, putative [Plasmodium malariae]